ncbi:hypothetical protein B0T26DRAFT_637671, partial [Lasiosphaeria miniovina]
GTQLSAPDAGLVLKKIAIGHGIQNYTCTDSAPATTASAIGALAILYDVTSLFPGTLRTGLSNATWNDFPKNLLYGKPVPLNLINPNTGYGATASPFPRAADLTLGNIRASFLGHHYFDQFGSPTFELLTVNLKASVKKLEGFNAPATADKGILNTGAVQWLKLIDNGKGFNKGLTTVYRVVTAGGAAEACSKIGPGVVDSVPYTTYYWFYGPK